MIAATASETERRRSSGPAAPVRGVQICEATTVDDLMATFRGRFEVFVGENILSETTDGLIVDEFDALPITCQLVAKQDGRVIGGCRATPMFAAGLPSDRFFDFRPHFHNPPEYSSAGSALWVYPDHRTGMLGVRLARSLMDRGREQGVREVGAAVRPEAVPIFTRLGWRVVADRFDHPVERAPVIPMVVDLHRRL